MGDKTARMDYPYAKDLSSQKRLDLAARRQITECLDKMTEKITLLGLYRMITVNIFGSASGEDAFDTKNSARCW